MNKQVVRQLFGRIARARTKILIRLTFRDATTRKYHGRNIRVPIIGDVNPDQFVGHEPQVDAILFSLLDQYDGAFIDIGANTGQTLLKVVTTDPNRSYIGFDASIFCAYYVDRLVKYNGFRNCTILPIGLSDRARIIDLQYSRDADGAATVVKNFWSGKNIKPYRQSVFVERGDTVLSGLSLASISAVKIDVEGGELEVLSGLRDTLAQHKPAIVMEVLPYSCDDDGTDRTKAAVATRMERINRLKVLITEISYSAYRLMPDGSLVSATDFDAAIYDPKLTNYLLLHTDRLQDIPDLSGKYRDRLSSELLPS